MKPLSPTAINLYKKCPRKFYYYVNRAPSLPPHPRYEEALEFGKLVHQIIARYYEIIPESLTPTEVKMFVTKAYKDIFPESMYHLKERVEMQLLNFIKFEKERLKWHVSVKPVAVEHDYQRNGVHGVVDALFRKGDDLVVVDWKTGRGQARLTEDIVVQMNVYLYLTKAKEAYVIFLEFGDYAVVTPSLDVEELVRAITSDNVFLPRKGRHCESCEYQMLCFRDKLPESLFVVYNIL